MFQYHLSNFRISMYTYGFQVKYVDSVIYIVTLYPLQHAPCGHKSCLCNN